MKKILVIDDSQIMRLMIKMHLRSIREINITEAKDGLDALEKISNNSFDLIITDLSMPRLDGLQLIKAVRKAGHTMPIIILTTKGEQEDVEEGLELGANNYLTKPVTGAHLTSLVMNHV